MTVIAVLAALVAVLAATAGFLLFQSRTATASAATLEPINSAAANPFMPPRGSDAPVATPPTEARGAVSGSTPGLFGGTQSNSCDVGQMSSFLQEHQDMASAWADAEGIATGDIPAYLHELTPVLLRADTYITNHGYRDGELTSYPAVLQAGTAVLIDGYGTPRVKCYCGNPVGAPPHNDPSRFDGESWRDFRSVTVIVIRPAPVVVQNLTVIDVRNNTVYNVGVPPWRWGPPPDYRSSDESTSVTSGSSGDTSTTSATTDTSTSSGSTSTTTSGQSAPSSNGLASPCAPAGVASGTGSAVGVTCPSVPTTTSVPSTTTTTTVPTTTTTVPRTTTTAKKAGGT